MATLRERQIASIERILNLNSPIQPADAQAEASANGILPANAPILSETGEPIWKVLVFDNMGRDVISSVLRVNDLRAWGVTIHLNINTTRHTIPDVPVIYLVEPTTANLELITSDLQRGLYSPAYINFLSSIPRPLLEDFATQTVSSGTADSLAQIYDQYLDYVVSEPDLFSLGMSGAYKTLNSAHTSDEDLDATVERIVSGLFSVVVTMGNIPIIRCPKGGAAELVAAKLDRRLRDHVLNSKTNLFSDRNAAATTTPRPLLLIVDRNVDLIPMFSHSWIYQSLIYDVLSMRLNKISMSVPIDKDHPEGPKKEQAYDLTSSDYFWQKNAALPFPQVAEDVTAEWSKYQDDANEVTRKTGTSSIDDLQGDSGFAAHLKGAMALLPELKERKATITMHMNILEALMEGIKDRKLDQYFQLEEDISKQTKAGVLELLKDPEKLGNEPLDGVRFFLQWYLTTEVDVSRADLESFTAALEAAGADTTSIKYIKTVRQLTRMTMISSAPTQPSQPASQLFGNFSSLSSRVTDRFKDAGLGANFDGLLSGIKNFLPANKDLTLTKTIESLMDPSNASSSAIQKTEGYLYFDPKASNARGTLPPASQARNQQSAVGRGIEASFGQRRAGFSEAILFTVGGGSMDEYANIQEWTKRTSAGTGQKRRIIYGSTSLYSANEFIKQDLAELGKEST
ncbi:Sec1-like protein [Pleomassaria siparia CBS 279.74]|uniref:Sec1-like protein n=1 Tax=Pleomassaria siparia CBS 279.74 TaxID=1314801 RepID=A0A6G1K1P3_9PLEO|nr:Sec1-like protein [Pleomassaria siparia CBS 279.74]